MKEITIKAFPHSGIFDANNYLVIDNNSKEAVLIDCSDLIDEVLFDIEKMNLNLKYVLLTHGHFDHVMGVNDTKFLIDTPPVLIHEADIPLLENINDFMKMLNHPIVEIPKHDGTLKDNDELFIGDLKIKVLHTPGHTKGSVCYLIGDNLFSGDTIFEGTVGRTDLEGGSFEDIKNSVKNKIFTLDKDTRILPGHGEFTSVEKELKYNDSVR